MEIPTGRARRGEWERISRRLEWNGKNETLGLDGCESGTTRPNESETCHSHALAATDMTFMTGWVFECRLVGDENISTFNGPHSMRWAYDGMTYDANIAFAKWVKMTFFGTNCHRICQRRINRALFIQFQRIFLMNQRVHTLCLCADVDGVSQQRQCTCENIHIFFSIFSLVYYGQLNSCSMHTPYTLHTHIRMDGFPCSEIESLVLPIAFGD